MVLAQTLDGDSDLGAETKAGHSPLGSPGGATESVGNTPKPTGGRAELPLQ